MRQLLLILLTSFMLSMPTIGMAQSGGNSSSSSSSSSSSDSDSTDASGSSPTAEPDALADPCVSKGCGGGSDKSNKASNGAGSVLGKDKPGTAGFDGYDKTAAYDKSYGPKYRPGVSGTYTVEAPTTNANHVSAHTNAGDNDTQQARTGQGTRPASASSTVGVQSRVNPVPSSQELNGADRPSEGWGEYGSNRTRGQHRGVDIKANVGDPVVATAGGHIVRADGLSSPFGNQVIIDHGNGEYSQSAHLQSISVKTDVPVSQGAQIGTVGRTGNTPSQGDTHLHYEERRGSALPALSGGTTVDPLNSLPSGYYYANGSAVGSHQK